MGPTEVDSYAASRSGRQLRWHRSLPCACEAGTLRSRGSSNHRLVEHGAYAAPGGAVTESLTRSGNWDRCAPRSRRGCHRARRSLGREPQLFGRSVGLRSPRVEIHRLPKSWASLPCWVRPSCRRQTCYSPIWDIQMSCRFMVRSSCGRKAPSETLACALAIGSGANGAQSKDRSGASIAR